MSQKPTDGELADRISSARSKIGLKGSWRHKASGNTYFVDTVALVEATLEPVVIYRRPGSDVRFTRPLDEFLERFE